MNSETGKDGWEAARATRRQMMKKGLALGGAAYVAPMIVGAVTPVLAQGVSNPSPGCVGASCGNFIACSGGSCFCWMLSTGGGFCGLDFSCSNPTCTGVGNTCAAGSVCAINTCCGVPTCTLISSLCASIPTGNRAPSSTAPSLPAPGSGLAASGIIY